MDWERVEGVVFLALLILLFSSGFFISNRTNTEIAEEDVIEGMVQPDIVSSTVDDTDNEELEEEIIEERNAAIDLIRDTSGVECIDSEVTEYYENYTVIFTDEYTRVEKIMIINGLCIKIRNLSHAFTASEDFTVRVMVVKESKPETVIFMSENGKTVVNNL